MKDELSNIINDYLEKQPTEKRDYIGASLIGHPCKRHIWYAYKGVQDDMPARVKMTFELGHTIEQLLLGLLMLSAPVVVTSAKQKTEGVISGTPDGIIESERLHETDAILEIKTAKHSSFQTFVNKGLKDWNPQYYAQIQAYMGMFGCESGYLLAIDKDTSQLHDERVEFDEIFYHGLLQKAQEIAEADTMPKRINESPLWYMCQMCRFKEMCHGKA